MPTDKRPTRSELAQQTLFTTDEVATYLRTTADAIRARVQRGEIPRSAIVQRSKYGRMTFKVRRSIAFTS
jgi:hypothetical protein